MKIQKYPIKIKGIHRPQTRKNQAINSAIHNVEKKKRRTESIQNHTTDREKEKAKLNLEISQDSDALPDRRADHLIDVLKVLCKAAELALAHNGAPMRTPQTTIREGK